MQLYEKNCMQYNYLLLCFCLFFNYSFSQKQEFDSSNLIKNSEYFLVPRENIHLHLTKSSYISNETIWFKGYVINKITKKPLVETTNVYVNLLNEKFETIQSNLILANLGHFDGFIETPTNLESGKYYIHAYTNFMNNFDEDESSLFAIEIINAESPTINTYETKLENATIDLVVEGGNFVTDCENNIGVSIKDCFGNGIKRDNIKVLTKENKEIALFSTNVQGYGSFKLFNAKNQLYTVVLDNESFYLEKKLPQPVENGIVMNVSNHLIDKNIIRIDLRTNEKNLKQIKNEKYYIVIQKNEKLNLVKVEFANLKNQFLIGKENLHEGINYIRLIDDKNNLISERVLYNHLSMTTEIDLSMIKKNNDTITVRGKMVKESNLSITMLPNENTPSFDDNSIVSSFVFNSYLIKPISNSSYYLKNYNRLKQYELDLALLNQNAIKYEWNRFLNKKIAINYPFEKGVDLLVSVNQDLPRKDKNEYEGTIISTNYPLAYTDKIDEKNQINFKNIFVRDSTELLFNLTKNKEILNRPIFLYNSVISGKKKFLKLYQTPANCENKSIAKILDRTELPINKNTIKLDNVDVVEKKIVLNHSNKFGNQFARVYKQNPEKDYMTIVDILTQNGYIAFYNQMRELQVYNTGARGAGGGLTKPEIFIDDFQLYDLSILGVMQSYEIDEIYFNKFDNSTRRIEETYGTIKIYRRKAAYLPKIVTGQKILYVSNGFQAEKTFENPYFSGFTYPSFKKYGIINWIPNITTDADGYFEFKVPILEQDSILLNVQGMDTDGNPVNINYTLDVKQVN
jgi:hypothetical protein